MGRGKGGGRRLIPLTKKRTAPSFEYATICARGLKFDSQVRNLQLYHWKITISSKTTKVIYFILHLWTVFGVYETYMAHPTSLGSFTLTKIVPCVKVWSRLLVNLHFVRSLLTIHRASQLKKYHAHRLKVMQFFLLIPLNVKLTVFITFMILLRWRKRLNTTGNWRLVNGTEQTE